MDLESADSPSFTAFRAPFTVLGFFQTMLFTETFYVVLSQWMYDVIALLQVKEMSLARPEQSTLLIALEAARFSYEST